MGRARHSDSLYKNWIDASKSNLESKKEILERIEARDKG